MTTVFVGKIILYNEQAAVIVHVNEGEEKTVNVHVFAHQNVVTDVDPKELSEAKAPK